MTLGTALFDLTAKPVDLLVRRWNWKAGLTSSLVRGIIFFLANFGVPNNVSTSSAFGTITTTYPPRQIQFALKLLS
jgi:hypothetical protein